MRNRLTQLALTVAFGLLLVQMVFIAPSQIRDADQKAALLPAPPRPVGSDVDQSMNGIHMIETQDGKKDWELWSERAVSVKTKDLLELEVVRAVFFSDNGVTFTVTGKSGTVHTKTKKLKIEGEVVTRSSNGYTFKTDNAEYNTADRTLVTESPVEMVGPKDKDGYQLTLRGMGMSSSLKDQTMDVLRDVRAAKPMENGRKATIKSQRSRFSANHRTAQFNGDVVLDMDSMRITGPEARFDYDDNSDAIRSVVFNGGARVSDAEKWATSQKLKIDFEKNRFTFRGNPRVVQNNDELVGEEIVFLDGGKRVLVNKARAKVDEKRLERVN